MPVPEPAAAAGELPLFPLGLVLFPGGLLPLRIFEPRYLDMVSACWRHKTPFGVLALTGGAEVNLAAARGREPPVRFESVGTLAEIDAVDAEQQGVLRIGCHGTRRFRIAATRKRADGLWLGEATLVDDDPLTAPEPDMAATVRSLATTIATLKARFGAEASARFPSPYRFEDAGWVANRWSELLPMSLAQKQQLLMTHDPADRLRQIDRLLRARGSAEEPEG